MRTEYNVPASNKNLRMAVGWDDELYTYYMTLFLLTPGEKEEEKVFINVGTRQEEIVEVEVLDRHVKKYSKVSDGLSPRIYRKLHDDAVWPEDTENDDDNER